MAYSIEVLLLGATMNKPCKHGHIDGALHVPCYQCRCESLERRIKSLGIRLDANLEAAHKYQILRTTGVRCGGVHIWITDEVDAAITEAIIKQCSALADAIAKALADERRNET